MSDSSWDTFCIPEKLTGGSDASHEELQHIWLWAAKKWKKLCHMITREWLNKWQEKAGNAGIKVCLQKSEHCVNTVLCFTDNKPVTLLIKQYMRKTKFFVTKICRRDFLTAKELKKTWSCQKVDMIKTEFKGFGLYYNYNLKKKLYFFLKHAVITSNFPHASTNIIKVLIDKFMA